MKIAKRIKGLFFFCLLTSVFCFLFSVPCPGSWAGENLRPERGDILEKLKRVTLRNDALNQELTVLRSGIEMTDSLKDQEIRLAKKESQSLQEQVQSLKDELDGLRKQISDRDDKAAKKAAEKSSVRKLKDRVKELETKNKKLEAGRKTVESRIKRVVKQNTALEEKAKTWSQPSLAAETPEALYNKAVNLQKSGRFDDAVKAYESVLAQKPGDADAHFNLAMILDAVRKDRKEAVAHYRVYLELKPGAGDELRVQQHITELETEDKIWGDSQRKEMGEKRGRW